MEAVDVNKMKENGLDVDLTMPRSDNVNSPDIKAHATAFAVYFTLKVKLQLVVFIKIRSSKFAFYLIKFTA